MPLCRRKLRVGRRIGGSTALGVVFFLILITLMPFGTSTPALTLLGAALTVGLHKGGLLVAVLILPLSIPVLIFGVSAATAGVGNTVSFLTPFLILCAMTLAAIAGTPFAAAAEGDERVGIATRADPDDAKPLHLRPITQSQHVLMQHSANLDTAHVPSTTYHHGPRCHIRACRIR